MPTTLRHKPKSAGALPADAHARKSTRRPSAGGGWAHVYRPCLHSTLYYIAQVQSLHCTVCTSLSLISSLPRGSVAPGVLNIIFAFPLCAPSTLRPRTARVVRQRRRRRRRRRQQQENPAPKAANTCLMVQSLYGHAETHYCTRSFANFLARPGRASGALGYGA